MEKPREPASPWTYALLAASGIVALLAAAGAWAFGLVPALGAGIVVFVLAGAGSLAFARGAKIPGVLMILIGAAASTCCVVGGAVSSGLEQLIPDTAALEPISVVDRHYLRHPSLGFLVGDPGERFRSAPQIAIPMSVAMNGLGSPLGGWGWADPGSGASVFAAAVRPRRAPDRGFAEAFLRGFVSGGVPSPTLDAPYARWDDARREVWMRASGTRAGSPIAMTARLLAWQSASGQWTVLVVAALSHPSDVWTPLLLDAHAPGEPWRGPGAPPPGYDPAAETLAEARALARLEVVRTSRAEPRSDSGDDPPPAPFEEVRYQAPIGALRAYFAPPRGPDREPAVLWLHAGIDLEAPERGPIVLAERGIAVFSPTTRGESDNPGDRQTLLGELEDVRAALDHLRSLPSIDPDRIVIMGHGGGATLAMLLAESGAPARAFVCFGGTEDVLPYLLVGPDAGGPIVDPRSADESWVRSPIHFLSSITAPTYFIEGRSSPNAAAGARLRAAAPASSPLRVIVPAHGDHDSLVEPALRMLAPRLRERGPLQITPEEIADLEIGTTDHGPRDR